MSTPKAWNVFILVTLTDKSQAVVVQGLHGLILGYTKCTDKCTRATLDGFTVGHTNTIQTFLLCLNPQKIERWGASNQRVSLSIQS